MERRELLSLNLSGRMEAQASEYGDIMAQREQGAARHALLVPVDGEVVVVIEPQRPVVVVHSAVAPAVVRAEEVVANVARQHLRRGRDAVKESCHIRLSVPGIDCTVCVAWQKGSRADHGGGCGKSQKRISEKA